MYFVPCSLCPAERKGDFLVVAYRDSVSAFRSHEEIGQICRQYNLRLPEPGLTLDDKFICTFNFPSYYFPLANNKWAGCGPNPPNVATPTVLSDLPAGVEEIPILCEGRPKRDTNKETLLESRKAFV